MTEQEMYEASFKRPSNFFLLHPREQIEIDKSLGILDWKGAGMTAAEFERFKAHYD